MVVSFVPHGGEVYDIILLGRSDEKFHGAKLVLRSANLASAWLVNSFFNPLGGRHHNFYYHRRPPEEEARRGRGRIHFLIPKFNCNSIISHSSQYSRLSYC